MHSLKVSDPSGCIWNARRDTEWCCCTMMLTAGSPCCIQRDFPICAAAGGRESAGGGVFKTAGGTPWWKNCRWQRIGRIGGVFKNCRWHALVQKLQVVEFSDGSQNLQVAGHGGKNFEGIESAGGVSYHKRWRCFQVKPSRRFVCDFVILSVR